MENILQTILDQRNKCLICSSEDLESSFSSNSLLWLGGDDEDFKTLGDIMSYLMNKETQYYANMIICSECTKNAVTSYKFMLQCQSSEKAMSNLLTGLKNITDMTAASLTNNDKVAFMQIDTLKGRFNAFCDTQVTQSLNQTLGRFKSILSAVSNDTIKKDNSSEDEDTAESSSEFDPSDCDGNYSDTNTRKNARCHICSKNFNSKNSLNQHFDSTHRPKIFQCDLCDRKFGSPTLLNIHKKKSHIKEPCYICGKLFAKSINLHDHIESHSMDLQCEKCMRKFTSNMAFLKHKRRDNCNKPLRDRQNLNCPECDAKYSSKTALNSHIEFKHRGIARFICEICSAKCQTKSLLEQHVKKCHTNVRASYPCTQCDKVFLTKSYCNAHIRMAHTGEISTKCYYCPEKFHSSNERSGHIRAVHKEKTFGCDSCNVKFVSMPRLLRHHKSKRCKGVQ